MHRRLAWVAPAAFCLAVGALALSLPATGQTSRTVADPHGGYGGGTDACESCHELHLADPGTALLAAPSTQTCLSCHDGSTQATDVGQAFGTPGQPAVSSHPLGPDDLSCADCHTGHRPAAEARGLLRVRIDGGYVYSPPRSLGTPIGDTFCYACHGASSTLPDPNGGHRAFETSAHAADGVLPLPASGSEIRCLACHEAHGSDGRALSLGGLGDEQLCLSCHTSATPGTSGGASPPWPSPVPGSDIVAAFTATPNDTSLADGNGIRIYHHPIAAADRDGGTRQVTCSSCHNSHIARTDDFGGGSKIADPSRPLAMDAAWVPGWAPSAGYLNRGSDLNGFCTTCHVDPAAESPLRAGTWVPIDVRLVDDQALDADGTAHDRFTAVGWALGPHGDPTQANLACTACHDFHGSTNAYLLRERVVSPATGEVTTIAGFDALDTVADRGLLQSFCTACHTGGIDHGFDQLCTTCHEHDSGRL